MDELSDAQKKLIQQIGYRLPESTFDEKVGKEGLPKILPKSDSELKHPTRVETQAEDTKKLAQEILKRQRQKNQ
jgi:hypothetical protein